MREYWIKYFPTFAFLGTAIGFVVEEWRLNLTLLVVCISFVVIFLLSGFEEIKFNNLKLFRWFLIASLPGSFINLYIGNNPILPLTQVIGVAIFWSTVLMILSYSAFSLTSTFLIYLQSAKIAAFVGIMQQCAYQIEFTYFWDLRWVLVGAAEPTISGDFLRVSSFFTEPSYFAVFLMPALYFSILRLTNSSQLLSYFSSFIFIIALINTFSAIGYVGLFLCLAITIKFSVRKIIVPAAVIIALISIGLASSEISSRFSKDAILNSSEISGKENISVLSNLVNLNISRHMINDHPIFGVGLGAYRTHSLDYLEQLNFAELDSANLPSDILENLTLADGGSMYLRLLPELGIIGLLLFFYPLLNEKRNKLVGNERYISNAALLFVAVYSIRSGQLIRFELLYFSALYALAEFGPVFQKSDLIRKGEDMIEKIMWGDKQLALIVRQNYKSDGIEFFTPSTYSQQLGYMNRPAGYVIPPHIHNPVKREVEYTKEVLIIKRGVVRVDFYAEDQSYLHSSLLYQGDIILLAFGGHGFEILKDAEILEVKQGPYAGDQDKTRFSSISSSQIVIKDTS